MSASDVYHLERILKPKRPNPEFTAQKSRYFIYMYLQREPRWESHNYPPITRDIHTAEKDYTGKSGKSQWQDKCIGCVTFFLKFSQMRFPWGICRCQKIQGRRCRRPNLIEKNNYKDFPFSSDAQNHHNTWY